MKDAVHPYIRKRDEITMKVTYLAVRAAFTNERTEREGKKK